MIQLKDLLGKYQKIILSEEGKIEALSKSIFDVIGVNVKKENIEIKNGEAYLVVNSIYKNEIFLKKEKIIKRVEFYLGRKIIKNIR